ncbi:sensor histidine kinase [Geitlerinema sp. P-1104]|uniref:sensor histidine kinase n=1 Tax=Geitlerinema sp. P-1104 TaxID=2546230 RepID=UPI00147686B7|nr:ATP-binding protein [Geitlerinema sp. P-1104]NMG58220.1 sensor histidine kinase [Geitlerinema sp. P-1104]
MFQATRRRLVLWYTSITALLLLLFATTVYLYVRNTLIDRVDDTLKHSLEVVERSLAIEEQSQVNGVPQLHLNLEASFGENADSLEEDRIEIEWFSPTGELLWSTLREPLHVPITATRTPQTVYLQEGNAAGSRPILRQIAQRISRDRQVVGYLRVSHPWFEIARPSRDLALDLGFGITVMIASVAAMGWWLSGLAMKPVGESYQYLKQFTADASHELRSPIASIQTQVQVALADPDLADNASSRTLENIERLTRRLGRLVDDLLFLTRQDSGMVPWDPQPVSLDALLLEVVEEQLAIATSHSIQLEFKISDPEPSSAKTSGEGPDADDPFSVLGDWDQLFRLFLNLLGNALRYTPDGGTVQVTLGYRSPSRSQKTSKVPGTVQVRISDTGIGIPADALPHVFERFYRVDPARRQDAGTLSGSGLGLAIAQTIVQRHGGEIRLDSCLNQGTTVQVTLFAHHAS